MIFCNDNALVSCGCILKLCRSERILGVLNAHLQLWLSILAKKMAEIKNSVSSFRESKRFKMAY